MRWRRVDDSVYHTGSRGLQERFDTTRLADLGQRLYFDEPARISPEDRAFIEAADMVFVATADAEGRPQCSYKGGDPGFVRVLDDRTLAIPNYDGNGFFLTWGNVIVHPPIGLLFIDFCSDPPRRMRVNGEGAVETEGELVEAFHGAQFVVRITATEVFPNCPRYVHRMELVQRSVYVPRPAEEPPIPDWKLEDDLVPFACLSTLDPAREVAERHHRERRSKSA